MKKAVICLRCGKREGFGKCHERIKYENDTFHLCVDCAQIAYKMKDAVNEKKTAIADELAYEFVSLPEKPNTILTIWFNDYNARIGYQVKDKELPLLREDTANSGSH